MGKEQKQEDFSGVKDHLEEPQEIDTENSEINYSHSHPTRVDKRGKGRNGFLGIGSRDITPADAEDAIETSVASLDKWAENYERELKIDVEEGRKPKMSFEEPEGEISGRIIYTSKSRNQSELEAHFRTRESTLGKEEYIELYESVMYPVEEKSDIFEDIHFGMRMSNAPDPTGILYW